MYSVQNRNKRTLKFRSRAILIRGSCFFLLNWGFCNFTFIERSIDSHEFPAISIILKWREQSFELLKLTGGSMWAILKKSGPGVPPSARFRPPQGFNWLRLALFNKSADFNFYHKSAKSVVNKAITPVSLLFKSGGGPGAFTKQRDIQRKKRRYI